MTGRELWDAMLGCAGCIAIMLTAVCLVDRRMARKAAAMWAAYAEVHLQASRLFPRVFRERDAQLKDLEAE